MRILRLASLAVIGWYLLLITLHFSNQRLLWNDEYCVFANIHHQPLGQLFQQALSHDQEFPRVYLFLTGVLASSFHDHLLAVRFFSFLSMLTAFLIWMYIAQKQLKSPMAFLTFCLCWSASIPLIYYASELKQYSMDVLVSSVFLLFLSQQQSIQRNGRYAFILGLLLLTGFFSYIAFLWMLLPLYNLWRNAQENSKEAVFFWFYLIGLMACLYTVYLIDFKHAHVGLLKIYWGEYFISFESVGEFFRSFQEVINNLISRWFAEKPKWIRMSSRFFVGIGFIFLVYQGCQALRKPSFRFTHIKDVALVILLICLILSAFQKLPFGVPRLSLFYAPILLFMTVEAFQWIKERNKIVYSLIQYTFLIYLGYVSIGIAGVVFNMDLGAQSIIWQ